MATSFSGDKPRQLNSQTPRLEEVRANIYGFVQTEKQRWKTGVGTSRSCRLDHELVFHGCTQPTSLHKPTGPEISHIISRNIQALWKANKRQRGAHSEISNADLFKVSPLHLSRWSKRQAHEFFISNTTQLSLTLNCKATVTQQVPFFFFKRF